MNIQCVISGFPFYRLSVNVRRLVASQIIACTNPDSKLHSRANATVLKSMVQNQVTTAKAAVMCVPSPVACVLRPLETLQQAAFSCLQSERSANRKSMLAVAGWLNRSSQLSPVIQAILRIHIPVHSCTYIIYCDQIINSNARGAVAA